MSSSVPDGPAVALTDTAAPAAAPRLRTTVSLMTGTALVGRAIGALTGIAAARTLGPSGRGELALLVVLALLGAAVGSAGLDLWAARTIAADGQPGPVVRTLRRHLRALGVLAGAVAAVVVAAGGPAGPALATAAVVWTAAAATLKLGVLQGTDRMHAYGVATLAGTAVYGVAVASIVLLDRATVTTFLLATAAGSSTTAVWPSRRPGRARGPGALTPYRDALRFGGPALLGGLVTTALYRVDVVLVALWRSPGEAGRYSVALAVAEILWVLPNSAAQAIVPRAAGAVRRVDTARVARGLLVGMAAAGVAVVAAGWVLVPVVFGAEFASARHALPGLALASMAVGMWKLFSFDLLAAGRPAPRVVTGLAGIVAMVAVDAVAVPRWGAAGASLGAVVGYGVAAGWCIVRWRQQHRTSPTIMGAVP